jgi:hypothetical protein
VSEQQIPRRQGAVASLVRGGCGPAFLKAPIGTASTGVRRVRGRDQVRAAAAAFQQPGAFAAGGVLVEEPVAGPLLMVQSVFSAGRLLALHANERTREGAGGGASTKTSRSLPGAADDVQQLGWHGALSLDAILDKDGPVWIDVNPRLVEPFNAARSGVDLLGPLLALARGQAGPSTVVGGTPGVRTHQLLLAVLGAAQSGRGRAGVARELLSAAARSGPYPGSTEELTPVAGDPLAAVPVAAGGVFTWPAPALIEATLRLTHHPPRTSGAGPGSRFAGRSALGGVPRPRLHYSPAHAPPLGRPRPARGRPPRRPVRGAPRAPPA